MKLFAKILHAILVAIVILAILFSLLVSLLRYNGYSGAYADLYSVAVSNVFAIHGHLSNGEAVYDPEIFIIETDDYGRTLFFYSEFYDDYPNPECDYGMAFVVMQYSEDGYAYYYPDQCYIPYFDVTSDWDTISAQLEPGFLDSLKKNNDWNLEPDTAKCEKVKISRKKPQSIIDPRGHEFNDIIYAYETANGYTGSDDNFYKFSIYCETDRFGRELHFVYGSTLNKSENGEVICESYEYAIILNPDGSCPENGIIRLTSPVNSDAAIHQLKANVGWNQ